MPSPSTGPVPHYDKTFYTDDVPHYEFDPAKANALLDEAGYKKGADGMRFKLRLLPAPFFNETKQFGDYLRQALAAIGIDAEIVSNDTPAHLKAVYTDHAFDITVGRRSIAATRPSRRPSCSRAVCRPACRSPTSTATPIRRSTS